MQTPKLNSANIYKLSRVSYLCTLKYILHGLSDFARIKRNKELRKITLKFRITFKTTESTTEVWFLLSYKEWKFKEF